jgi:hypothetical protein
MVCVAVAGGALAIERVTDIHDSVALKAITAVALVGIFVSFIGFLSKLRE